MVLDLCQTEAVFGSVRQRLLYQVLEVTAVPDICSLTRSIAWPPKIYQASQLANYNNNSTHQNIEQLIEFVVAVLSFFLDSHWHSVEVPECLILTASQLGVHGVTHGGSVREGHGASDHQKEDYPAGEQVSFLT